MARALEKDRRPRVLIRSGVGATSTGSEESRNRRSLSPRPEMRRMPVSRCDPRTMVSLPGSSPSPGDPVRHQLLSCRHTAPAATHARLAQLHHGRVHQVLGLDPGLDRGIRMAFGSSRSGTPRRRHPTPSPTRRRSPSPPDWGRIDRWRATIAWSAHPPGIDCRLHDQHRRITCACSPPRTTSTPSVLTSWSRWRS